MHAKQSIELDHLNSRRRLNRGIKSDSIIHYASTKRTSNCWSKKNQALTLELGHLRRIRYGVKSEAPSQPQLSLFEEDWQTDVSLPRRRKSSNCRCSLRRSLSAHALGAVALAGSPAAHRNTAMNRQSR
ncbi:MAG: transposase [Nitrosomonas sp.]|nr:transposase [Nitrosomonas sp.]